MTYPNLKAEMARYDISKDAVAVAAGVSTRTVYNWLHTNSCPSLEQAKAIRKQLFPDLDLSYLFE